MTVEFFDHYSPQKHESVTAFLSAEIGWGAKPWNDMNIPVGLSLFEDAGIRKACVLVLHPRKSHAKEVTITLRNDDELEMLRATFVGIAEALYGPAASNLERFAHGAMPEEDYWGGCILYYWQPETLAKSAIAGIDD